MSPTLFVIISILLNALLSAFVLFRNYKHRIFIPLLSAGLLLPFSFFWGLEYVINEANVKPENVKIFFLLSILCSMALAFLIQNLMQRVENTTLLFQKIKINRSLLILLPGIIGGVIVGVGDLAYEPITTVFQSKSSIFTLIQFVLMGLHLYSLYSLENTYRYAQEYQRRIARLFLIPMVVILVYHIFFFTAIFLYHKIFTIMLQSGLVIQGITYPVMLLGFFRYRLAYEQVSIPRNTVYTSVSLFLAGSVFLGIGLTLYLFKLLHIDFEYFELALLVFTVVFLLLLLVSSGDMRRRIILFVNKNFYSSKYDYRNQFFRLHKSYMHGNGLHESVVNLVENMKYAVAAHDAFVFLREPHSNSFSLNKNPEFTIKEPMVFPGNDPIIVAFENNFEPIDLIHDHHKKRVQTVSTSLSTFIEKLSPSIIFPIPYDNSLIGLLVLNIGTRILDSEDIEFIKVFTESIGSTYYKDYLMQTTIENSQFQSFNQVVSFVVHDIKNQIATLSLLAKNADNYIDNIDFQKSLIRSIRSSSENLTTLVDKLSTKRKGVTICVESQPILPILEKVLDNSIVAMNKGIQVEWVRKESCTALIDSSALEQVLLNLVKNASEAMQSAGTIRLYCSPTLGEHGEMIKRFNLPPSALQAKSAIIIVEDTGCGMDKDFIETKLFKPFETTKDKGIGIGLYQCKTYVEKMKGVLLCDSHLNEGTAFCILL